LSLFELTFRFSLEEGLHLAELAGGLLLLLHLLLLDHLFGHGHLLLWHVLILHHGRLLLGEAFGLLVF